MKRFKDLSIRISPILITDIKVRYEVQVEVTRTRVSEAIFCFASTHFDS